jgi:hypothetical protein
MAYLTCGHGIIYPIREPLCYTGVFKKYLYIKRSLEDLGAELILLYFLEWFHYQYHAGKPTSLSITLRLPYLK